MLGDQLETGSECELTARPAGTAYRAEAMRPRLGMQEHDETIVGNTDNSLDGPDIEMGVWVEHDWKFQSQQR